MLRYNNFCQKSKCLYCLNLKVHTNKLKKLISTNNKKKIK